MNLRDLNTKLIESGGFSYSLTYGDMIGKPYYAVSLSKGTELVTTFLPTEKDYKEYIEAHSEQLAKEDAILGAWEGNDGFYLDITTILSKREYSLNKALKLAEENEQLAIYDLEYEEEIYVKLL